MCRARCALGSATTTTVASSTMMSWAIAMIARVQYRLGSGTVSSSGLLSRTSVVISIFLPAWLALRGGAKHLKTAETLDADRLKSELRFRIQNHYSNDGSVCQHNRLEVSWQWITGAPAALQARKRPHHQPFQNSQSV